MRHSILFIFFFFSYFLFFIFKLQFKFKFKFKSCAKLSSNYIVKLEVPILEITYILFIYFHILSLFLLFPQIIFSLLFYFYSYYYCFKFTNKDPI
jgi:hypothetical protein